MDIAIFGGSFDPPHIGHEQIVNLVLKKLKIDKLFIIPTYLNPFKSKFHLSPNTRLELIKDLFEDENKIQICDYEILQNKQVPSFETINYLKANYDIDKIYLIIGADNLKKLHLWYNIDKLDKIVKFVVINRDSFDSKSTYAQTINFHLDINISSTQLRQNIDFKYIPQKIKQKVKQLWKHD